VLPKRAGGVRMKPWDRRADDGETPAAWRAFLRYRDLGSNRTLDAVCAGQGKSNSRATGTITAWSSRHAWVIRAAAWDAWLQDQRDKETAKVAARWEKRRLESLEDGYAIGKTLQDKVRAALKFPLHRESVKDVNGVQTAVIEPAKWVLRDLALIARMSADLIRESIDSAVGTKGEAGSEDGQHIEWTPCQVSAVRRTLVELAHPGGQDDD
jgi:hypothetical protein